MSLFATPSAFAATSATINPVLPKTGHMHLSWLSSYYNSTENFSQSGGSFDSLPNDGSFQEFQNAFLLDYDLNSRFRLKSAFNVAMVQTKNSTYSKSNSYFDHIRLGSEFWFLPKQIPSLLNFEVTIPIFTPDYNGSEATASEGVYSVEGDFILMPKWGRFRGNVQGGLLYLMDGRGGRIPWNVGASFGLPTGRIEGGIRGQQTVIKGSNSSSDHLKRTNLIVNGQAGSLKYFSVDPSFQELYVSSRWGMIRALDLSTDLAYAINGEKYAKGFTVMFGLHWMLGLNKASATPSPSEDYDFEYESEGKYRESLFDAADPSRAKKKPAPRPRQKSIKQLMDETERALDP